MASSTMVCGNFGGSNGIIDGGLWQFYKLMALEWSSIRGLTNHGKNIQLIFKV